jgi:hypothetical protein
LWTGFYVFTDLAIGIESCSASNRCFANGEAFRFRLGLILRH